MSNIRGRIHHNSSKNEMTEIQCCTSKENSEVKGTKISVKQEDFGLPSNLVAKDNYDAEMKYDSKNCQSSAKHHEYARNSVSSSNYTNRPNGLSTTGNFGFKRSTTLFRAQSRKFVTNQKRQKYRKCKRGVVGQIVVDNTLLNSCLSSKVNLKELTVKLYRLPDAACEAYMKKRENSLLPIFNSDVQENSIQNSNYFQNTDIKQENNTAIEHASFQNTGMKQENNTAIEHTSFCLSPEKIKSHPNILSAHDNEFSENISLSIQVKKEPIDVEYDNDSTSEICLLLKDSSLKVSLQQENNAQVNSCNAIGIPQPIKLESIENNTCTLNKLEKCSVSSSAHQILEETSDISNQNMTKNTQRDFISNYHFPFVIINDSIVTLSGTDINSISNFSQVKDCYLPQYQINSVQTDFPIYAPLNLSDSSPNCHKICLQTDQNVFNCNGLDIDLPNASSFGVLRQTNFISNIETGSNIDFKKEDLEPNEEFQSTRLKSAQDDITKLQTRIQALNKFIEQNEDEDATTLNVTTTTFLKSTIEDTVKLQTHIQRLTKFIEEQKLIASNSTPRLVTDSSPIKFCNAVQDKNHEIASNLCIVSSFTNDITKELWNNEKKLVTQDISSENKTFDIAQRISESDNSSAPCIGVKEEPLQEINLFLENHCGSESYNSSIPNHYPSILTSYTNNENNQDDVSNLRLHPYCTAERYSSYQNNISNINNLEKNINSDKNQSHITKCKNLYIDKISILDTSKFQFNKTYSKVFPNVTGENSIQISSNMLGMSETNRSEIVENEKQIEYANLDANLSLLNVSKKVTCSPIPRIVSDSICQCNKPIEMVENVGLFSKCLSNKFESQSSNLRANPIVYRPIVNMLESKSTQNINKFSTLEKSNFEYESACHDLEGTKQKSNGLNPSNTNYTSSENINFKVSINENLGTKSEKSICSKIGSGSESNRATIIDVIKSSVKEETTSDVQLNMKERNNSQLKNECVSHSDLSPFSSRSHKIDVPNNEHKKRSVSVNEKNVNTLEDLFQSMGIPTATKNKSYRDTFKRRLAQDVEVIEISASNASYIRRKYQAGVKKKSIDINILSHKNTSQYSNNNNMLDHHQLNDNRNAFLNKQSTFQDLAKTEMNIKCDKLLEGASVDNFPIDMEVNHDHSLADITDGSNELAQILKSNKKKHVSISYTDDAVIVVIPSDMTDNLLDNVTGENINERGQILKSDENKQTDLTDLQTTAICTSFKTYENKNKLTCKSLQDLQPISKDATWILVPSSNGDSVHKNAAKSTAFSSEKKRGQILKLYRKKQFVSNKSTTVTENLPKETIVSKHLKTYKNKRLNAENSQDPNRTNPSQYQTAFFKDTSLESLIMQQQLNDIDMFQVKQPAMSDCKATEMNCSLANGNSTFYRRKVENTQLKKRKSTMSINLSNENAMDIETTVLHSSFRNYASKRKTR